MAESSTGQKVIAVIVLALVVAFASLIASLPNLLPSHQTSAFPDTAALVDGDIAWMIVSTVFGLFLSPALVYLYSLLNGNDANEILKTVLVIGSIITFLWVLFTFSLVYGKDTAGNGVLGYPITYYMFARTAGQIPSVNGEPSTIPASIYAVFELGFALLSPSIVAASVAGRTSLNGFLLFIFVWHILLYCPVAHIVWNPRGAFASNNCLDFSGALPVHVLATITALVLHGVLGKDAIPKSGKVAHPEKALFSAFLVWFLWFGFNSGKAHAADSVAAQSIVNTIAATMTGILSMFFYNLIFEKPTNSVTMVYAILISLIGITPASGFVTVGGAMVIAIFVYFFTIIVAQFLIGEGYEENDPISVVTLHGIAGTVGFLWTAILSYRFINPAGHNGLTFGRGIPLAYHISFTLALYAVATISCIMLAVVCNLIVPIGEGVIPANDATVPSAAAEEADLEKAAAREEAAEPPLELSKVPTSDPEPEFTVVRDDTFLAVEEEA